jgi:FAD:protein FMN transferase
MPTGRSRAARWRALGTDVHVVVNRGDLELATAAVERVLDDVDRTYSRFRPDSELSRLNGRTATTTVSPLMARAIEAALRGARATDGLVDPTVGRAMRAIGYDEDFAVIGHRHRGPIIHLVPVPGWQAIDYRGVGRTVRLRPGIELDFGSTGKALAADLAVAAALAALGPDAGVVVSLGGDVAMAGRAPDGGWRILAADSSAVAPDADGEVVALHDGAIATSSTTVRRWTRGETTVHHIIDPRTGAPAQSPWRTASVVAGTCVDANIAATAAILLGEAAPDWLAARRLPARLVSVDGCVERLAGWPNPEARGEIGTFATAGNAT